MKNFKFSSFTTHLCIMLIYPLIKLLLAKTAKLVVFLDSLTIICFFFIIFGIINSMFLHGDFDITGYILERKRNHGLSYDVFKENQKLKRKDSFNYPLYLGIIVYIICTIVSLILY